MNESPPCRIVQMTLNVLNIKHELIHLDLFKGEARTPEYLELNPQHTVPLLVDGDFRLNEARPICTYLIGKYGKKHQEYLYPADDAVLKAKIDQRLYFDMGTFFETVKEDYVNIIRHFRLNQSLLSLSQMNVMFRGGKGLSEELAAKYAEVLGWVNKMVKSGYVAGTEQMSLADLSLVSTFSTLKHLGSIDTRKYPFIEAWYQRCKQQIPNFHEACGLGAENFGDMYRKAKAANNR